MAYSKSMAELFETTKQNISLHIKNISDEKEVEENSVVKENLTTAKDLKNYKTKFYNLDLIIAEGYRVKSVRGKQFRNNWGRYKEVEIMQAKNANQRIRKRKITSKCAPSKG